MSAGIVFLYAYISIGAVLACLSLWLCRRHPDDPSSRELRSASMQELVAGFMLSLLAWPWAIYIAWKKRNDQP